MLCLAFPEGCEHPIITLLPCYHWGVLLIPCLSTVCSEPPPVRQPRRTRPGDHSIPERYCDASTDHPRRASQRSPSPHGANAPCPLGEHWCLAGARIAP